MTLSLLFRTNVTAAILLALLGGQAHAQTRAEFYRLAFDVTGGRTLMAVGTDGRFRGALALGSELVLDQDTSVRAQVEGGTTRIASAGISLHSRKRSAGRVAKEFGLAAIDGRNGIHGAVYAGGTVDSYLRRSKGAITFRGRFYAGSRSIGLSLSAGYKWLF